MTVENVKRKIRKSIKPIYNDTYGGGYFINDIGLNMIAQDLVKLFAIPDASNVLFCKNCNHLAQHTKLKNKTLKCQICGNIAKL